MTHSTHTKYVSDLDDMLQMLASLDHRDNGDEQTAATLSSGLNAERQVHALSNLSRILVQLLETRTGSTKAEVYGSVRQSVIAKMTADGSRD
jgi:hypothetical protein